MTTKNITISVLVLAFIIFLIYIFMQPSNPSNPKNASENSPAPSESVSPSIATSKKVVIETSYGKIKLVLYDEDTPKTVENFIKLADKGFYNGIIFHRVIKGFMIQGGDPTGTGMGGPGYQFADELNPRTLSYKEGYKKGVVAMANAGPNTNGSQFFIMLQDTPLPHNYTIFGKVISGQDVVDKIGGDATGANDKPINPIKMDKVYIVE